MKFKKETLFDLLCDDAEGMEKIRDQVVDTSRWSLHYDLVFKEGGRLWRTGYSTGATEQQGEAPWEYEGDEIECVEVEAFEVTTTEYRVKKGGE